tara:strand:- start:9 stop:605 length:597 start_codon:yes stop_codon:yes gene_type:complete
MATKTKVKDKIKDALKLQVKSELVGQKEKQQEEIKKRNADLREVIVYTKTGCPYCKQLIDKLNEDGIKFIEKIGEEHPEEWSYVATLTNVPVFPTILVNENYLTPRRDFQNVQQAIQGIVAFGNKKYINPPFEERMIEMIKTMGYGFNQALQTTNQQIRPLISFIETLQKELAEEEGSENSTTPQTAPAAKGGCGKSN